MWKEHGTTSAGSTINADEPKEDLLEDTVSMLRSLAVEGLPMVVFVEDLHLADELLIKLLIRVLNTESAVMVVTTGWPGTWTTRRMPSTSVARDAV